MAVLGRTVTFDVSLSDEVYVVWTPEVAGVRNQAKAVVRDGLVLSSVNDKFGRELWLVVPKRQVTVEEQQVLMVEVTKQCKKCEKKVVDDVKNGTGWPIAETVGAPTLDSKCSTKEYGPNNQQEAHQNSSCNATVVDPEIVVKTSARAMIFAATSEKALDVTRVVGPKLSVDDLLELDDETIMFLRSFPSFVSTLR